MTNKYYKINNVTGETLQIHNTGDFIKRFNPSLTGAVGFKDRIKLAGDVFLTKKFLIFFLFFPLRKQNSIPTKQKA